MANDDAEKADFGDATYPAAGSSSASGFNTLTTLSPPAEIRERQYLEADTHTETEHQHFRDLTQDFRSTLACNVVHDSNLRPFDADENDEGSGIGGSTDEVSSDDGDCSKTDDELYVSSSRRLTRYNLHVITITELGDLRWLRDDGDFLLPCNNGYVPASLKDRENRVYAILDERALTSQFSFTDYMTAINQGRDLAMIYMHRQNWFQAERTLEELVIMPARELVQPVKFLPEISKSLDSVLGELIALYKRFQERIKVMVHVLDIDVSSKAVCMATVDRVARLDVDELSKRVFDEWWVDDMTWYREVALHFAAAHNACNIAHLALNRGANVDW
ncbi:MAG: hypothetical protein Q9182_002131 [Xanthomendoza sp. 2 TL-2023]